MTVTSALPIPAPDIAALRRVGGPVRVSWREGTLTRAYELETLCDWMMLNATGPVDGLLAEAIKCPVGAARDAAVGRSPDDGKRWRPRRNGPLLERAMSNLDAAEAQLLNLAPATYVAGQMPSLLRHVQRHLRSTDPGRQAVERIAEQLSVVRPAGVEGGPEPFSEDRNKIVTTVRAASSEALREDLRLRSFRNIVVVTTVLLTLLAIGVALIGVFAQNLIPLCFAPEETNQTTVVCPTNQSAPFTAQQPAEPKGEDIDVMVARTTTRWDLIVVELVGLTAAAIASAAAISHVKGSSERYGIPVALAALKLPTGALTAFLGLLLMRGQFVPGLNALDTSAQILAWGLVFGYAQQVFTRLIDQQGQSVLNSVRSADQAVQPRGRGT